MEAELWTASTRRSEILGDIAIAHRVPESQVQLRLAE